MLGFRTRKVSEIQTKVSAFKTFHMILKSGKSSDFGHILTKHVRKQTVIECLKSTVNVRKPLGVRNGTH